MEDSLLKHSLRFELIQKIMFLLYLIASVLFQNSHIGDFTAFLYFDVIKANATNLDSRWNRLL